MYDEDENKRKRRIKIGIVALILLIIFGFYRMASRHVNATVAKSQAIVVGKAVDNNTKKDVNIYSENLDNGSKKIVESISNNLSIFNHIPDVNETGYSTYGYVAKGVKNSELVSELLKNNDRVDFDQNCIKLVSIINNNVAVYKVTTGDVKYIAVKYDKSLDKESMKVGSGYEIDVYTSSSKKVGDVLYAKAMS